MGKLAGFLKRIKHGTKKVGKIAGEAGELGWDLLKMLLGFVGNQAFSIADIATLGLSSDWLKLLGRLGKKGQEKYKLEKGPKGWLLRVGSKALELGDVFGNNTAAGFRKFFRKLSKGVDKLDTKKQEDFDK